MKKIINYGFIFCLSIAVFFGFATPKNSKAAIIQPEYNNPVDYSKTDYTENISDYSLFNNYDYSYLDTIDVGVHLTSSNIISTSLTPNSTTGYGSYCFGNLCYSQNVYILKGSVYSTTSGGAPYPQKVDLYTNYGVRPTYQTLIYDSTTCNTATYYNNSIFTSPRNIYFVFTNINDLNNLKSLFDLSINESEDIVISTSDSLENSISKLESTYNTKILYEANTGFSDTNTQRTSTCTTSSSNTCGNVTTTYNVYFYGIEIGNITLSRNATYYSVNNKCVLTTIGTSINNGFYFDYNINFKNLPQHQKKAIWNKLTQQNQTDEFTQKTFTLNGSNSLITGGMNINIYLQLNFKGNINYQYNNLYIKFDSNTSNTLEYIYYGIFDLNVNYMTNNTYVNYLLNEPSIIQSEYMTLLSTLQTNGSINYYLDYNFNLALISDVVIDQILSTFEYDDCKWYQFMCHLKNGFNKLLFDMPILSDFNTIFDSIVSMVKATFDLFEEYKEITFLGTICVVGLLFHFIKRSTE